MNLRWLSAPDDEVTTAIRNVRTSACPPWLPSRREVLAHVDDSLLLLGPLLILIYRASSPTAPATAPSRRRRPTGSLGRPWCSTSSSLGPASCTAGPCSPVMGADPGAHPA
ncbi:hypothetical protein BC477_18485 [Clavibacter michiganensis subsp. michiganensis]|uniref:Uncharacterized protein n=1 Tax=Clavibacter michiganensis subsp. michiganensis TaxID=33013 RepID=A0A251XGB0_CLAMM|nr:hypothetical protein BC477_18485 [Clavibacter michiganensis subsp. michiganensis]OUE01471.1 hypothetical protein CMMCAS07_14270 [Clavibacter michiganensis subsp. michiganensis]